MTMMPAKRGRPKRKPNRKKRITTTFPLRPRVYQPNPSQLIGGGSMAYFRSPVSVQRGRGLGGFLASVARSIVPIFRKPIIQKGLKSLGQHAILAGTDAVGKALARGSMEEKEPQSFRDEMRRSARQHAQALVKEIRAATMRQPDSFTSKSPRVTHHQQSKTSSKLRYPVRAPYQRPRITNRDIFTPP